MTALQWNRLFQTQMGPVYDGERSYVDLSLVSTAKYPALEKLAGYTTLEILLLAWLISWRTNTADDGYTGLSVRCLEEIFENYDCPPADIGCAIDSLHKLGLVEAGGVGHDGTTEVRANLWEAWLCGLYHSAQDNLFEQAGFRHKEMLAVLLN